MKNPTPLLSIPALPVNAPEEAHVFRDLVAGDHVHLHRDVRGGVWWTAPDYERDPGSLAWVAELWTTAWSWFAGSQDSGNDRPRRKLITSDMLTRKRSAKAWIGENLDRLLTTGWTRKTLFKAGKHPHPCGQWGLCWCWCWSSPDLLSVSMDDSGGVAFLLAEPSGREVVQTARPRP